MKSPEIKIMGVGGCGGNLVEHLARSGLEGIALNTDAASLKKLQGVRTALIGKKTTRGKGAKGSFEKGERAALEDAGKIRDLLRKTDILFILAGMGGGTGTGASPVIAGFAREKMIYTSALITRPMEMEGNRRMAIAKEGILRLRSKVDSMIEMPNLMNFPYDSIKDLPLCELFEIINDMAVGIIRNILPPINALLEKRFLP